MHTCQKLVRGSNANTTPLATPRAPVPPNTSSRVLSCLTTARRRAHTRHNTLQHACAHVGRETTIAAGGNTRWISSKAQQRHDNSKPRERGVGGGAGYSPKTGAAASSGAFPLPLPFPLPAAGVFTSSSAGSAGAASRAGAASSSQPGTVATTAACQHRRLGTAPSLSNVFHTPVACAVARYGRCEQARREAHTR